MGSSIEAKVRVLFVCTGNICRSPTAHFVFEKLVRDRGLADRIMVDSAGTHGYHVGGGADPRSAAHAARRGYDLSPHCVRQLERGDFADFDHILVMDDDNHVVARRLGPPGAEGKLRYLLEFAGADVPRQVPDPYSGGEAGFEVVLDLIETACIGFLDFIVDGPPRD